MESIHGKVYSFLHLSSLLSDRMANSFGCCLAPRVGKRTYFILVFYFILITGMLLSLILYFLILFVSQILCERVFYLLPVQFKFVLVFLLLALFI